MNTNTLILFGACAVAAFLLLKPNKAKADGGGVSDLVQEVLNASQPGDEAYGWTYYNNGVAISPTGDYYKNGVKVWGPTA